jgi:hypothetical protein
MGQTYLSIPRLHRLEYLEALLHSYSDGEFDEERAKLAVQREIQEFEQKKARALRRQRPRTSEGTSTLAECLEMARHLGLIDSKGWLKPKAAQVLDPDRRRHTLLMSIWQTYPRFSQIVLTVRDAGQLELPFYNWDKYRKEGGDLHGLNMDRKNFEITRDFATQLGLINWYPTETRRQIVYPVACVATQSEILWMAGSSRPQKMPPHQCRHVIALETGLLAVYEDCYEVGGGTELIPPDYLVLQIMTDRVFIRDHDVDAAEFEQTVWREYLRLADMIPMSPVLYPSLRNQVCNDLRISDQVFDRQLISLIKQPHRLNIHPSDGTLSYAANLAHIGKFLPPQTSEGNFIVYLKMERRSSS